MIARRAFGTTLILFSFVFTFGQDLNFSHLTSEDGLSNNTVHCVYQDSRGFMWFGTDDGLNLYNGYEFDVFKYNSQDTSNLSSNSVFGILEDSKGRLWMAGSSGIDIFNRETISFQHIPFVDDGNSSQYQSYTRAITEDQDGNIFIANTDGVFIYDSLKKGFVRFLKDSPNFGTMHQEGIRALLIDRNRRLWVASLSYGLYCFDLDDNEVISSQTFKEIIDINSRIYVIAEDLNGDVWIGTDNGIYLVAADLSEVSRISVSNGLSSNNIQHIYIDDENKIWVGTDGGGLCLYNKASRRFTCYKSNEFSKYSLNNNSVRSIWKDKQGILWLGTYQGGVNYASLTGGLKFNHMSNEKGNINSLSYNAISAIFEDREGNLWIGTDGGGLDFYNRKENSFKHYKYVPGRFNTISGNSILTITEDGKENIWIGGYLLGINIINKSTQRIKVLKHNPEDPNSLSNDDVRDIYIQDDTTIWIATNGGGLNQFNPVTNRFSHFRERSDNSVVDDWCLKLFMDSYGYLWIGTYAGLSIYDTKNNEFRNYSLNINPGSLSNNWIYAFAEDREGNIWIGTANGLNIYDRKERLISPINTSGNLPNEVINGILIDKNENLWLSTNKGISKYNPSDASFKNFDVFDGLQGLQFIHGSYFKTRDGEMFFGGLNGLNSFYPDSIQENKFEPNVYLTDFLIFYEEANINADNSPLLKSITESDEINIDYKQSVITIKYAALNFFNTKKNQYRYILEGSEKEWNNVGTRREATYTNLTPGKYTFKVMASNNDGVWNENAASIRIIVHPPWWQTLFFRILIIIIFTSILVGYYFFRISELKKRQIQLEEMVDNRTKVIKEQNSELAKQADELSEYNTLLEERQQMIEEQTEELVAQKEQLEDANKNLQELNLTKDKFFSIIAHDLKNPFNTILGFAELLNRRYDNLNEEKRRSFSKAIYESSENVYNLLENLLIWARSQTNRLKVVPANFNMNILIEENIVLLKEMYKDKEIELVFESSEIHDAYADRNMINTVVRNLLTNAAKFTNKGGKVSVSLRKNENDVILNVNDNGVGISEEEQEKLFRIDGQVLREGTNGELGTGLGLLLCKEYIEKNNGRIWVESNIDAGSDFYIAFPLQSS